MFENKKELFSNSEIKEVNNQFLREGFKASVETFSGNGALKYSTSGNAFVDDFANLSKYRSARSYNEIDETMTKLWSIDPLLALKETFFIRMITRKPKHYQTVQRGQGLKNEGIWRMMWIAINHPQTFMENITLWISAASWKDIFQMLSFDLQYNGWKDRKLPWNFLFQVILAGLQNPDTSELVKKYMPTIRTNSHCKTIESQANTLVGRWLANKLFGKYDKTTRCRTYAKLKASGTAHKWQQAISQQLYDCIDFNTIAGRALAQLVGSKFLSNHGLEKNYVDWIKEQPVAKYTGYVYELFSPIGEVSRYNHKEISEAQKWTINKQYAQLLQTGKQGVNADSKLIVVRDTSGSMQGTAVGTNVSANQIAKGLAMYFSEFLDGPFKDTYLEFDNEVRLNKFTGSTPVEKWYADTSEAYGSTNFLGVADFFEKMLKKGVPEKDFPTGILCVSDGEFNGRWSSCVDETNFHKFLQILKEAGFSDEFVKNFKIILWDVPNSYYGRETESARFEDFADAENFFYMSGYDGSTVSFILGGDSPEKKAPKTAEELFHAAMDQELLNKLIVK